MGMRGAETESPDDESLLDALRRSVGVEPSELLSDAKAAARKSLICATMRNGPPPYPLLRRLWQAERVRDYVAGDDDAKASLTRRLRLWRRGFEAETEPLYDFDRYPPSAYVSDYEYRVLTYYLNEPWTDAVDNKLLFHWLFAPFDEHRMDVYGLLEDGYAHPVAEAGEPGGAGPSDYDEVGTDAPDEVAFDGSTVTRERAPGIDGRGSRPAGERVLECLREEGRLVLKHATGAWGTEVVQCDLREGTPYLDGEPYDEEHFERRVAALDGYLICEFVEQAAYADRLYPDAANTIRVTTMWDDEAGEAFVPMAVQRIGTAKSAPLDNAHRGALVSNVDLETGELSAATASEHPEYVGERFATHPETGAQLEGVEIPGWRRIRDRVLEFAESYPFLPYVGWDVLVTDAGEFTILEANNHADVYLHQIHRPLLADPRTRRFFVSNGVITERRARAVAEALDQSDGGTGRENRPSAPEVGRSTRGPDA